MKSKVLIAIALVLLIVGGGVYYLFLYDDPSETSPKIVEVPPPATISPHPFGTQQAENTDSIKLLSLPGLSESDSYIFNTLADLIDKKYFSLLYNKNIIRNIVITIDNLPRKRLPVKTLPVRNPKGPFLTSGTDNDIVINPKNAARYSAYVKMAEALDAENLVKHYLRLYPLFQQAYKELGYPQKQFNVRLMEALNDLLSTPDIGETVQLIRPNVFYSYADPALEIRSAGQRILLRIGNENAKKIKLKLQEIRKQLLIQINH